MEWDVAISWHLRGLRGCYGVCPALNGKLPRTRNNHNSSKYKNKNNNNYNNNDNNYYDKNNNDINNHHNNNNDDNITSYSMQRFSSTR